MVSQKAEIMAKGSAWLPYFTRELLRVRSSSEKGSLPLTLNLTHVLIRCRLSLTGGSMEASSSMAHFWPEDRSSHGSHGRNYAEADRAAAFTVPNMKWNQECEGQRQPQGGTSWGAQPHMTVTAHHEFFVAISFCYGVFYVKLRRLFHPQIASAMIICLIMKDKWDQNASLSLWFNSPSLHPLRYQSQI